MPRIRPPRRGRLCLLFSGWSLVFCSLCGRAWRPPVKVPQGGPGSVHLGLLPHQHVVDPVSLECISSWKSAFRGRREREYA